MRVGLLGGSFDPAHEAHRAISLTAMKRLQLDSVWWLVSPGNPLKGTPSPMEKRIAAAQALAHHPRILATDIEARLGTVYTIDTIRGLRRRWPATRFVWIIGADNLGQIHRWKNWRALFRTIPVAVIDRPGYRLKAVGSPASTAFGKYRIDEADASALPALSPPAWAFLTTQLSALSSTELRAASTSY